MIFFYKTLRQKFLVECQAVLSQSAAKWSSSEGFQDQSSQVKTMIKKLGSWDEVCCVEAPNYRFVTIYWRMHNYTMDVFWLARMFEGYSQGEEMLKLGQEVNMRNRYHSKIPLQTAGQIVTFSKYLSWNDGNIQVPLHSQRWGFLSSRYV